MVAFLIKMCYNQYNIQHHVRCITGCLCKRNWKINHWEKYSIFYALICFTNFLLQYVHCIYEEVSKRYNSHTPLIPPCCPFLLCSQYFSFPVTDYHIYIHTYVYVYVTYIFLYPVTMKAACQGGYIQVSSNTAISTPCF